MHLVQRAAIGAIVVSLAVIAPEPFSTGAADACINVAYRGLKPNSKERRAIDVELRARNWAAAKTLLLAARAKAHRVRDRKRAGLIWNAEAWVQVQLARTHYHLGDLKAAQKELGRAYVPSYGTSKRHRALILDLALVSSAVNFRLGKPDAAIKTLGKAIERFPKDARLHAQLAFHESQKNIGAALVSMAEALRLNPKHHGGMEWVHFEVLRYRVQLALYPTSAATHPLRRKLATKLEGKRLKQAVAFAANLAPELRIR